MTTNDRRERYAAALYTTLEVSPFHQPWETLGPLRRQVWYARAEAAMALADEERAASSAVVAPAADQTALRDRIAEALMRWTERGNSPQYAAMRRPETVRANAYSRADAVLAVLPTTDRAAVLREAAALLHQRASSIDALSSSDFGEEARAVGELAE